VVDSFSKDRTVEIARACGAEVFQNRWTTHAGQMQWAMENCAIATPWTLRIDADEICNEALHCALREALPSLPSRVTGVFLRRQIVFLGRRIRWGFFDQRILRLWRTGQARVEQRMMDEHVTLLVPGVASFPGAIVDHNLNSLSWWTAKHDRYAYLEACEAVRMRQKPEASGEGGRLAGGARIKRLIKERLYYRVPSAIRSTLYFLYRYVCGLGFLDGKAGFYFHFLQAYWYRTLVDAKLLELQQEAEAAQVTAYQLLASRGVFG